MKKRVVIVGGGINGLTAANYLQKQSFDVKILEKNNISPEDFLMVGNSLKSDVLPVRNIGGTGIYITPVSYTHLTLPTT